MSCGAPGVRAIMAVGVRVRVLSRCSDVSSDRVPALIWSIPAWLFLILDYVEGRVRNAFFAASLRLVDWRFSDAVTGANLQIGVALHPLHLATLLLGACGFLPVFIICERPGDRFRSDLKDRRSGCFPGFPGTGQEIRGPGPAGIVHSESALRRGSHPD